MSVTQGQSKTASLAETAANIAAGFVASIWLTEWLLPSLGYYNNVRMACFFTVVSLVRGFVIRRIFNYFTTHEL